MAYHTTILRQIIDIFPRHEFDSLAKDFHVSQKFRSFIDGRNSKEKRGHPLKGSLVKE